MVARFIYVDEAGISDPAKEPFLVVSGVIVDADRQLNELERRIAHIADKVAPAGHHGFVFHATELFNGGKSFSRSDSRWPLERRLAIARDLACIPAKMGLPLAFGIVQRAHWPLTFDASGLTTKERTIGQHLTAYMCCAMEVERWMREKTRNEVALIIAEDNDQARSRIRETQNFHRRPDAAKYLDASARKHFPFRKIKASPLFEKKADSPALQMADFCAYVMKKRAMNDMRYADVFSLLRPQFVAADFS